MKYFYLLLLQFIFFTETHSQINRLKIQFGDVKPADFEPAAYSADSSANAVYLFNGGYTNFVRNKDDNFDIQFTHFSRIRLLKKNSFSDAAVVEIPLVISTYYQQKLIKFAARTYNIIDGKLESTYFDKIDLFEEKALKMKRGNVTLFKFPFPGIKEGTIIEYTYTVQFPGISDIPSWRFQTNYPCLWSEYEITQPEYFTYRVTKHGNPHFDFDSAQKTTANFGGIAEDGTYFNVSDVMRVSTKMLNHVWAMKNVAVLKEEPYISDLLNYQQAFDFDLYAVQYPSRPLKRVIKEWKDEIASLLSDEDFGEGLNNPGSWINDPVNLIMRNENSRMEKAKKIFYYVRDNFTCTGVRGKYLSQPLKQVFQKKAGSIADLNLLLTAMYIKAGFVSKPVILSTRDNGVAGETYPSSDNYNYLITLVQTDNEKILLDAGNKYLPFNKLTPECYNGNARVIDTSYSPIMLSADSLKENSQTTVFIVNTENNPEGSLTSTLGAVESFYLRKKLSGIKEEDFFKEMKKKYYAPVEITNMSIDSLKKTEYPLRISYDIRFLPGDEDFIYFNPMLSEGIKENPFKSESRLYPVEMPYCINDVYVMNMEIPKGYTIDELPKSAHVSLNENEGFFEYAIGRTETNIQLKCTLKLNKANFSPGDYQTLRDFYSFIVKKQAEQIVFKKNK
jgi:uncharacterized protein DUF3858/transglutaminase superfamily protein